MKIIYRIININNQYDDWLYELTNNGEAYYWKWLQLDGKNTAYPTIRLCPTKRGSVGNFGNSLLPKIPFRESDLGHH